jgi:hypothetical protein
VVMVENYPDGRERLSGIDMAGSVP